MIEMPPPWEEAEASHPRDRVWNLFASDLMSSDRKLLGTVVITEPAEHGGYDVHLSVSGIDHKWVHETFPECKWELMAVGKATHYGGIYKER